MHYACSVACIYKLFQSVTMYEYEFMYICINKNLKCAQKEIKCNCFMKLECHC